jgi:RES domain-containing protein
VVYPPELLDRLQAIAPGPWAGTAYRHMFASYRPDIENTRGARWNPPNTAAIYASLTRDGALAEANHAIALQPLRPSAKRTLYEIEIVLSNILDLSDRALLAEIGIGAAELDDPTMEACREVGGAVAWLEHDGLLVPSARSDATNLVIFAGNQQPDSSFEVLNAEEIES